MAKVMYAKIKLVVKDDADTESICGDTWYEFNHQDIISTEWTECEEVNNDY